MHQQKATPDAPVPFVTLAFPVPDVLGHFADPDVVAAAIEQMQEAYDQLAAAAYGSDDNHPGRPAIIKQRNQLLRDLAAMREERDELAERVALLERAPETQPTPMRGACVAAGGLTGDPATCAACNALGVCMAWPACTQRGDEDGDKRCERTPCVDCRHFQTCPADWAWNERPEPAPDTDPDIQPADA